jgi:hypothetical protein
MWEQKEGIGSDFAFLPFLFQALWPIDRTYPPGPPRRLPHAAAIGLLLAITASFRTIGLVLLPAWIGLDLVAGWPALALLAFGSSLGIALWTAQGIVPHSLGGTLALLAIHPRAVSASLLWYARMLGYWWAGTVRGLTVSLYGGTLAAAAWVYFRKWRNRAALRITETFLFCYMAALLFYSPHEVRFLNPPFPIGTALSIEGANLFSAECPLEHA